MPGTLLSMTPASSPTVAVVTDLWPSEALPAGGRFVYAEVEAMSAAFRQVVLVPSLLARRLHRRIWHGAVTDQHGWEQAPGVRVLEYPMVRIPRSGEVRPRALGLRLALRRAGEQPHLVHGHFLLSVAPAAVAVARAARIPSLVTAHGTDARWLVDDGVQRRHRRQMLAACTATDRVVAVSRPVADILVRAGVASRKIHVVPMGVDAELFRPGDRDAARTRLGLPRDARVVAFVGRLDPAKGVDVLAASLGRLDDVVGIAVGPGAHDVTPMRTLGVLPPAGVAEVLAAADVLCLPSFAEGMPVSVSEALAAGRPVVATPVGGIPDVVRDGVNGVLVPPGDVDALTAALQRSLETRWSPEAIRETSKSLWWSEVAGRLGEIYGELVA